tara:strand:- start:116 stop:427 length:312 start_codon:yes stop_codon:yes gene_type:complete
MDTIKVGSNIYKIEYPTLHNNYNPIYSKTYNKIYYGCHKNCKICKEWNTKSQIWKNFSFFPLHCHLCQYAGNIEDFEKINIFMICKNCNLLIKKRKKILIRNK